MSSCPICEGNFETCQCTGIKLLTALAPRAGVAEEIGRQDDRSGDDGRGYERDETDRPFRDLVEQLLADGDDRAATAGRRACRTLAEMATGRTRQPVLRMTRELAFIPTASKAGADDACVLCGWWTCRCGGAAPAPTPSLRAVAS
ncbi:hypothetical protein ACIQWZ_37035 [Streptomyces sp. NPDC098077]|uniref:hypothetical protein n=1 Tax=Streptomyces sp. NPDC098077 TaxID=3366093 RepID=UPI0037FFD0E0